MLASRQADIEHGKLLSSEFVSRDIFGETLFAEIARNSFAQLAIDAAVAGLVSTVAMCLAPNMVASTLAGAFTASITQLVAAVLRAVPLGLRN